MNYKECKPQDFSTKFTLPNRKERPAYKQWSMIFHDDQRNLILKAIEKVKPDIKDTFGNTNLAGNAVYEIVRQWAEQKKLKLE